MATTTSGGATTDGSTGGSGMVDGSTGTDSSSGESTGSGLEICESWLGSEGEPMVALYDGDGVPLASGDSLEIECGGQGFRMFAVYPRMGGWEPDGLSVPMSIEVIVDGVSGPSGSFFLDPDYPYSLDCTADPELEGGGFIHDCIAILPPDEVADLPMLDGRLTEIHVSVSVPGMDPIAIDLVDMTLSVPEGLGIDDCF